MRAKTVCLIWLVFFMILDIVPVPVLGTVLFFVIINRPPWFKALVERLYRER